VFLKYAMLTRGAREALSNGRAIKPRVKRLGHNSKRQAQRTSHQMFRKCQVKLKQKNVTSARNATWTMGGGGLPRGRWGRGLRLSLKQVLTQDRRKCVPSRSRALTKGQGQRMVGPLKGSKEEKSTGWPLESLPR